MNTITFRKLKPSEIELRVGATTESGFSLLLYKTARVDANILDETVGAFNWQKRFYQVKQTMICSLGIYFEDRKEWIWKDDAGDESNTEAIKGEASDSFKRAGFAFGIGRELYTAPFVWIWKDENNDPRKSHYTVQSIEYQDNEISKLVITNDKTKEIVYKLGSARNQEDLSYEKGPAKEEDMAFIRAYMGSLNEEQLAIFNNWVQKICGVPVDLLNAAQAIVVRKRLESKK